MKKTFLVCLALGFLSFGCYKDCAEEDDNIPACIESRIQQIKSQPKWNPPAQINEYQYNGQSVYLISSPCCDRQDTLVDRNCNFICAPTGGISGNGDGKCSDFTKTAKHVRLVWRDERN